jgi:hypothetical protein
MFMMSQVPMIQRYRILEEDADALDD